MACAVGYFLTRLRRCNPSPPRREANWPWEIIYLRHFIGSDFYCQFCREDLNYRYEFCISTMSDVMKDRSTANDLLKNSSLYREFQAEREEILRHKWIESEKVGHDIGFEQALTDWIIRHRSSWRKTRQAAGSH